MMASSDKSTVTFSSSDFDREKYAKVARSAQLRELSLVKSSYSVKLLDLRFSFEIEENLIPGFSGEPTEKTFDEDSGLLVGEYRWRADIKKGRTALMKFSADFLLVYGDLNEVDPNYAVLYFDKIARFSSYPYFRSLFAINSAGSSISLSPLPSLTDRVD